MWRHSEQSRYVRDLELAQLKELGVQDPDSFELHNSVNSPLVPKMVDLLYARLQRRGYLRRDCERMVNRDRNIFGSLLVMSAGYQFSELWINISYTAWFIAIGLSANGQNVEVFER